MSTTQQSLEFAGFRCQAGNPRQGMPTVREVQVLAGLAAGLTQKEIAKLRGVSPSSIKSTAEAAYYRLSANRATDAVAKALRRGWIAPLLVALVVGAMNPTSEALRVRQPVRTRQQVSSTARVGRRDLGSLFA
ncbi:response regulator transcription factor [Billgrantia antri]|uniref:Response regulator transcription factor n=1 Tax=Halomonas sulfidivorans TaxID=2733488 RepID=A0ABX7WN14_9GAMM|nr:LuxR C-terminal-related transcriptional regulator [Halomonas sulfidivorans]QTP60902.1 response regulator transcription factor [Halomonas sulfidivorans]